MSIFSILILIVLFWYTYRFFFRKPKGKNLMLILGSGGHTTEILRLIDNWPGSVCAVHASGDEHSKLHFSSKYTGELYAIPRSRQVGQSYFTSIFTTLYSFLPALWLVFRTEPDLIISNGPGTALPVCYCAFVCKYLALFRTRIVFVESFCRTSSLSLAGKLIYPITDEFYVQWESLLQMYPKAKFIGMLC
jgi:beta-1,4-N-acetylglucosaminyltransferase